MAVHMDDVVVFERSHDLADCIRLANVREELVAQSLAFARALDDAGDVDEGDGCRHDLVGVHKLGQYRQPFVGQWHDAGVRFDRGEWVILRKHVVAGERVEHGGLAHIGQADNSDSKRHSAYTSGLPSHFTGFAHLRETPVRQRECAPSPASRHSFGIQTRTIQPCSMASTALITAPRNARFSSSATPLMVVPPGEHTASFMAPG